MKGKVVVDKLKGDFELLWSTKILFQHNNPTTEKFIELDIETRRMMDFTHPTRNQSNNISIFSENNSSPIVGQASRSNRR